MTGHIIRRYTCADGAGGGAAADPVVRYLRDLDLGSPVANGGQVAASSMVHNGFRVQLTDGTGATIDDLTVAPCWSAPIPADILGTAVGVLNLGQRLMRWSVLERQVSALPMSLGVLVGFCEGANPVDNLGQGIGIGLEWNSTNLRLTTVWRRNDATGVWTRQRGSIGQAACFGSETTNNPHGLTNLDDLKVLPLDATYEHGTIGSNSISQGNVVATNLLDHIFVSVYRTAAVAGTPTVTFDAGFFTAPDLRWD